MGKKKQFRIPGIYHDLLIKIVSQKWLAKHADDKDIMGYYEHGDAKIYVVRELSAPVKLHTFYHEVSHHIDDTLRGMRVEDRCDLLGSYLMKLAQSKEIIEKFLTKEDE